MAVIGIATAHFGFCVASDVTNAAVIFPFPTPDSRLPAFA